MMAPRRPAAVLPDTRRVGDDDRRRYDPRIPAEHGEAAVRGPRCDPEWGVTEEGNRFLFAVPVRPPSPFNVVRDWQAMLSK